MPILANADDEDGNVRRLGALRQLGECVGRADGIPAVREQDNALDAVVQLLVDDGQQRVAEVGVAREAFFQQFLVEYEMF